VRRALLVVEPEVVLARELGLGRDREALRLHVGLGGSRAEVEDVGLPVLCFLLSTQGVSTSTENK
jgi:hypothetical protein